MLAIALFTYDLRDQSTKISNFYYKLNSTLREQKFLETPWAGYFYYLQNALSRLQSISGIESYRGVSTDVDNIKKEYKVGRRIRWTGCTSTSKEEKKAKSFAGTGGVIFKIRVIHGKELGSYSVFPHEQEVLLFANCSFLVLRCFSDGGFYWVELQQEDDTERPLVF